MRREPGIFHSQSQNFQKLLQYKHLTSDDLDIAKMESLPPKIKEYSRYDLTIFTPTPFYKICYKLFLGQNENGELCFITHQEAGINENEFSNIKEGPGYFSMSYNVSDKITSIINLVDQENGITTQIKTFNYVDDLSLIHI